MHLHSAYCVPDTGLSALHISTLLIPAQPCKVDTRIMSTFQKRKIEVYTELSDLSKVTQGWVGMSLVAEMGMKPRHSGSEFVTSPSKCGDLWDGPSDPTSWSSCSCVTPIPWVHAGPKDSLRTKWWDVTSRLGYEKTVASILFFVYSLLFVGTDDVVSCPVERKWIFQQPCQWAQKQALPQLSFQMKLHPLMMTSVCCC